MWPDALEGRKNIIDTFSIAKLWPRPSGLFLLRVERIQFCADLLMLLALRQQAAATLALAGAAANEAAGRQARVFDQHLKVLSAGKALAPLPTVDAGHGQAEISGDLFEGHPVLSAPVFEGGGKADAEITLEFQFLMHVEIASQPARQGKE